MLPTVNPSAGAQTRMRQEGMDPIRETPVGTHHPSAAASTAQIEDLKRSIESRFASVSSPSNFLQAGVFNTLGNNPVSQTLTAAGGAVGDIWDSLLSGPDKENKNGKAKDPLQALNAHTKILNDILDVLDNINDYIHFRDSNRHTDKKSDKIGPKSGKHVKQDEEKLKKKADEDSKKEQEHAQNKKTLDTLTKEKSNLAKEIEDAKTPEEKAQLQEQSKLLDSEVSKLQDKVKKGEERGLGKPKDLEAKPAGAPPSAQVVQAAEGAKGKEGNALAGVLDKLGFGKTSKAIEKFSNTLQVASKNLSKTFSDTSKTIKTKSKPLADAIKGSETAKLLGAGKNSLRDAAPKISSVAQSAMARIAIPPSVAAQPAPVPPEAPDAPQIQPAAEPQSSALSTATDLAGDAAEAWTAGKVIKGGASKVAGWLRGGANIAKDVGSTGMQALRGGGAKALEMAKNAGGFLKANAGGLAKTAGIAHLATSGIEAAYDSFHTGTDEYAKRMGAKAGESTLKDMGIRAAGTMQDLGNRVTFGGADRLSNWMSGNGFNRSEYYQDKPNLKPNQPEKAAAAFSPVEQPSRASAMQSMKSEADKASATPAGKAEPQAVIGAVNNVSNSTTILPSRHEVRNNDASFNRYLDRSLG